MKPYRVLALELLEESKYAGTMAESMLLVAQAQTYATLALAEAYADR